MTEQMAIDELIDFMYNVMDDSDEEAIPFVKDVIEVLEEIQQYRAIGTVEGYERAIEVSKENYRLYLEYKAKVQAYEAIGTVEEILKGIQQSEEEFDMLMEYRNIGTVDELQALKEKSVAKKPIEQGTDDKTIYKCSCGNVLMEKYSDGLTCGYITNYCKVCGQKLLRAEVDWE